MQIVYVLSLVVSFLLGLVFFYIALRKPGLIVPLILVGTVLGAGPKVEGHGLVDEYLLACGILGFLMSQTRPRIPGLAGLLRQTFTQKAVFPWLMVYFVIQSFRGMAVLGEPLMFRFVVMFAMILLATGIIADKGSNPDERPDLFRMIGWVSLLYVVVYMLAGYFCVPRSLIGVPGDPVGKFDLQYYGWSGTTVAVIPVFLCYATALVFISSGRRSDNVLGWFAAVLSTVTAFYYDSRLLLLVILFFIFCAIFVSGLKKASRLALIFCVTMLVFVPTRIQGSFAKGLFDSTKAFSKDARPSDSGRRADVIAAIRAVSNEPLTALFGYGWYTHRVKIVYTGPDQELMPGKMARPAAFSSFLVDTGLIGILLISLSFLQVLAVVYKAALTNLSVYRWPIMGCVFFTGFSAFLGQTTDLVLFYLMMAPSGIAIHLLESRLEGLQQ